MDIEVDPVSNLEVFHRGIPLCSWQLLVVRFFLLYQLDCLLLTMESTQGVTYNKIKLQNA